MPNVSMVQKRIIIKDEATIPIMQALDEAAQTHGFDEQSDVIASESQARKPRWWTQLIGIAEKVSGSNLGTHERIFSRIEVEMDGPAFALRDAYRNCLNDLIIQLKLTPKETEVPEIGNRFILVYEILLRLVTLALSNRMDPQKDGKKILSVMIDFINKVNTTEVLEDKNILGKSISKMNIFFCYNSP